MLPQAPNYLSIYT